MAQRSILSFFKSPSSSISARSSSMFPPIFPVQEIDTSFNADLSVHMSSAQLEKMVTAQLVKLRELREKLLLRPTSGEDLACLSSSCAGTHAECADSMVGDSDNGADMVVDSEDNDTDMDDDNIAKSNIKCWPLA